MERLVKPARSIPATRCPRAAGRRVIKREATLGEIVGPDREALMVLADMTTLWVLADVPEDADPRDRAGFDGDGYRRKSGVERSHEGRVAYIAPELDKATRTAQVRIEVHDGTRRLKPGHVRPGAADPAPPAEHQA